MKELSPAKLRSRSSLVVSVAWLMHGERAVKEFRSFLRFSRRTGVFAETGEWTPPNWVSTGLTPASVPGRGRQLAGHGAQLIGGCCGTGPEHVALLAARLARAAG